MHYGLIFKQIREKFLYIVVNRARGVCLFKTKHTGSKYPEMQLSDNIDILSLNLSMF